MYQPTFLKTEILIFSAHLQLCQFLKIGFQGGGGHPKPLGCLPQTMWSLCSPAPHRHTASALHPAPPLAGPCPCHLLGLVVSAKVSPAAQRGRGGLGARARGVSRCKQEPAGAGGRQRWRDGGPPESVRGRWLTQGEGPGGGGWEPEVESPQVRSSWFCSKAGRLLLLVNPRSLSLLLQPRGRLSSRPSPPPSEHPVL